MSANRRLNGVLARAFRDARAILDEEARSLFAAEPGRYSRFVFAVGWGPTLFDIGGNIVKDHKSVRAKRLMSLADRIMDRLGADNHEVRAPR